MVDALFFVWTVRLKVCLPLTLSAQKHREKLCSGLCLFQASDLATNEGNQTLLVGNAKENSTVDHYTFRFEMNIVVVGNVCCCSPSTI